MGGLPVYETQAQAASLRRGFIHHAIEQIHFEIPYTEQAITHYRKAWAVKKRCNTL
jgi:hypothetical protein